MEDDWRARGSLDCSGASCLDTDAGLAPVPPLCVVSIQDVLILTSVLLFCAMQ